MHAHGLISSLLVLGSACGGGATDVRVDREIAAGDDDTVRTTTAPDDPAVESATPEGLPSAALSPRGHERLSGTVEGVLSKGLLEGFELERGHTSNGHHYYFVVEGYTPVPVLMNDRLLDAGVGESLGLADAAVIRAEIGSEAGCSRGGLVCIASMTPLPFDLGAVLEQALSRYRGGSEHRTRLSARAARHAERELEGRRATHAESRISFRPDWSPGHRRLTITVIAIEERVSTTEEPNPDPGAGSYGCDAPPGADCAPEYIPESLNVSRIAVGEAAEQLVFDSNRTLRAVRDGGEGARPVRVTRGGPAYGSARIGAAL